MPELLLKLPQNILVGAEVWTMSFDATGPEGGDYDGFSSVHSTSEGATALLVEKLAKLDIPAGSIYRCYGGADGYAGDLESDTGWKVSFGIHRSKVCP